jgi:hypothetical protein
MATATDQGNTTNGAAGVRTETLFITPDLAENILRRNVPNNRHLRAALVAQLAGAMERGEWSLNGETIKLDTRGYLVDGQHRLSAVVTSGLGQWFIVIRGVTPDAQDTVDIGAKRSFADLLHRRGEVDVNSLAAAVRLIWSYDEHQTLRSQHVQPTPPQLFAVLDRYPELREALAVGRHTSRLMRLPVPLGAALHTLFARVDQTDADAFFERLAAGVGDAPTDPIVVLRRTLQAPRPRTAGQLPTWFIGAITIKAFNAWRSGRAVKILAYRAGGASGEPFPLVSEEQF